MENQQTAKRKIRVRYQRGSIESTIRAAIKVAAGYESSRYVYAIYSGFVIEPSPPTSQSHYLVAASGDVVLRSFNHRTGTYTEGEAVCIAGK